MHQVILPVMQQVTHRPLLTVIVLELLWVMGPVLVMVPCPRQATVPQLLLLTPPRRPLVTAVLRQLQVMAIPTPLVMNLVILLVTGPPAPPMLPLRLQDTAPLVLPTLSLQLLGTALVAQLMVLLLLMATTPPAQLTLQLHHPNKAMLVPLTILLTLPVMPPLELPMLPLQVLRMVPLVPFTLQVQHVGTAQLLPATQEHPLVIMDMVDLLLVMALDTVQLPAMDLPLLRTTLLLEVITTTLINTPPSLKRMAVVQGVATGHKVTTRKMAEGTPLPVRLTEPPMPPTQHTRRHMACLTTSPCIPAKKIMLPSYPTCQRTPHLTSIALKLLRVPLTPPHHITRDMGQLTINQELQDPTLPPYMHPSLIHRVMLRKFT